MVAPQLYSYCLPPWVQMFWAKFHVSRMKNVGLAPIFVERGPGAGGHIGFLHFEALIDIFELGTQQIWIQHTLIPLEMLYTKNNMKCLQPFIQAHFLSLFLKIRLKQHAYIKMLIYPDV